MYGIQLEIQILYCTKSQLESHVFVVMHSCLTPHSSALIFLTQTPLCLAIGAQVFLFQHATKDTAHMIENCPLPCL
jgi:hypothetical protein